MRRHYGDSLFDSPNKDGDSETKAAPVGSNPPLNNPLYHKEGQNQEEKLFS